MIKAIKTKTLILVELLAIGLYIDWDTLYYRTQHRWVLWRCSMRLHINNFGWFEILPIQGRSLCTNNILKLYRQTIINQDLQRSKRRILASGEMPKQNIVSCRELLSSITTNTRFIYGENNWFIKGTSDFIWRS